MVLTAYIYIEEASEETVHEGYYMITEIARYSMFITLLLSAKKKR